MKTQTVSCNVSHKLLKKTLDKNLHILADVKKEIKKTKDFNQVVNWAVKMSILVSIPTVIGLIILSKPILISLLNYKEFSLYDVDMTSISLIALSITVRFRSPKKSIFNNPSSSNPFISYWLVTSSVVDL